MRKRDRAGLAMGPLFLRLALAVTFIWAGLGKFMARMEVQGEQAAILANYGVIPNPNGAEPQPGEQPPADETPAEPETPAPEDTAPPDEGQALGSGAFRLASWQDDGLATASDFPEPVEVRRWAGLLLGLHTAMHPGLRDEDSAPKMPLWFDLDPSTDYDPWPKYFALAVAITELVAGLLLVVGLLTRLSALSLAVVMLGAIWLTTVGPALQSGDTVLGFLPAHEPFGEAWTTPLLQFTLLCSAMGLFFVGPGTLSLDRLLLGGPPRTPAPKPAPPPPPPAKK